MSKEISLKNYTTFHIGGMAKAEILTEKNMIEEVYDNNSLILGYGSNVLISDSGVSNPVIINRLHGIKAISGGIYADSGVPLAKLCKVCLDLGLSGLEWAYGIPGSVGGAVYMNAGAFGGAMADVVSYTDIYNGSYCRIPYVAHSFSYRHSRFMDEKCFILGSAFRLTKDSKQNIFDSMAAVIKKRRTTQPTGKSAGSVFVSANGIPAAFYIDKLGLKGLTVGGATVSSKHANFIINNGNATAKDVKTLIEKIEDEVFRAFNIRLKTEIRVIGDN